MNSRRWSATARTTPTTRRRALTATVRPGRAKPAGLSPGAEVVALIEILDEASVLWLPAQELLRKGAGGRVVERDERTEEAEMVGCSLGRDAGHRDIKVLADRRGDVAERHALVADRVQPGPGRRAFQCEPVQPGRVERVPGGPAVGAVADIARHALLAGDGDQCRDETVQVKIAVHGWGQPDHR